MWKNDRNVKESTAVGDNMEVRKYLFWMADKGIQTYRATGNGTYELVRFKGEDRYTDTDISKFMDWFKKNASITEDEYIDFCYLSDKPLEVPPVSYNTKEKSSWNKKEISIFCDEYINIANYEVIVDENNNFLCQSGNLWDEGKLQKLYLKCVPEFSMEPMEKEVQGSEKTSLVNQYFRDKLRELDDK